MPGLPSGQSQPATSAGALRALPACHYNDYCEAQRCLAEANSRRDTLRTGKKVVYKAPCDLEQPKPAEKPKAPEKPEPTTAGGWRQHVGDEPSNI